MNITLRSIAIAVSVTAALLASGCGSSNGGSDPMFSPSANQAPTISALADVAAKSGDAIAAITFTVSDDTTDSSALNVTATSSDQSLIADADLVLSGNGNERSLAITPAIEALGEATLTITALDAESLSGSSSFRITINVLQVSASQFVRDTFARAADAEPALVNGIELIDDIADESEFDDLIGI